MYSFEQVLFELENAISLKTLKTWASKIEKLTDTKFERRYSKNRNGRNYSYKVFSFSQVEQFKHLVCLRSKSIALDKAIYDIFMSEEGKITREEISLSKRAFEENKADTKKLIELTKKSLQENAELKKRILRLEQSISIESSDR
ncbi:hypothetical protein [Enterococcus faecium]|uniref:hypothetical protein n=1 Tax=Enterococcus faecium TaxID=1352 RepID=UPI0019F45F0B|nr:hypothetical protein [Enterococcus faecium]ELS0445233.1 hypothetical protein [Enterococcus faecium]UZN34473.1 hypothetical protein MZO30_04380 [Enterococcus faecium]